MLKSSQVKGFMLKKEHNYLPKANIFSTNEVFRCNFFICLDSEPDYGDPAFS